MRKFFTLAAAIFVLLSAALFGLYEYSTSPKFCRGCHFMRPYYESWKHSSHRRVSCLVCHFEPGTLNELRGKWRALSQFTSYITGTYTSKPYAEVSDRSCLQMGCHSTRLLQGRQTFKRGIIFDHRPHLLEMRRGMKLRCTSCHSQIVIGTHVEVTESTCFLCHFRVGSPEGERRKEGPSLGGCPLCHGPPAGVLRVAGMEIRHQELVRRGIACTRCHADVVSGRGDVARERCFDCHNQPQKIEKLGQVELIHINHIALHRIECERCHSPIQHGLVSRRAQGKPEPCGGCHEATHNPQQALYLGRGGRGVEAMPDPMSRVGMGCTACHVVPQRDPEEANFFGQTFISSSLPCYACHGRRYEGFLPLFRQRLEEMLSFLEKGLNRERRHMASPSLGMDERERFRLQTLLRNVEFNVRFVKEGKGIHNPLYALELLRAGRSFLEEADRSQGKNGGKGRLPIGFRAGSCREVCHKALPEPTLITLKGGKAFPHPLHLARLSAEALQEQGPCAGCHVGKNHPYQVSVERKDCLACHHRGEREEEKACPKCHRLQLAFAKGKIAWTLRGEIEADNDMEDVECTECHDLTAKDPLRAMRENCVSCHEEGEKDYGKVMDEWLKTYGGKLSTLSVQVKTLEASSTALSQRDTLRRLKSALELLWKARPVHNVELAEEAIRAIEEGVKGLQPGR